MPCECICLCKLYPNTWSHYVYLPCAFSRNTNCIPLNILGIFDPMFLKKFIISVPFNFYSALSSKQVLWMDETG